MKAWLSQREVEYTAKNVSEDPQAMEELFELGYFSTPVTVIDGQYIRGFDRGQLEKALATRGS